MSSHKPRHDSARDRAADRYRVLIEVSPQAIWEADAHGALTFVNQFGQDYTGWAAGQLLGDGWLSVVHSDQREQVHDAWLAAIQQREQWEFNALIRRADGDYRWFVLRGRPVKDAQGVVRRWVGVALDVHDRKLAADELRNLATTLEQRVAERTRQLEQANQAKSDFLAHMSHEIRTPLTGVLGLSELMAAGPLTDEQRKRLALLRSSATALQRLLTDILDFAKIEAGMLRLETVAFDPTAVVHEVVALYEPAACRKGLVMMLHCDEMPYRCLGDPTRLRQVLLNLLDNAVKFTFSGRIEVRAWSTEAGSRLHYAVRDTGIGLSPAVQNYVFDAFTQADASTARRYGGTGLGLTICKRLVNAMGGRIFARPGGDVGSVFEFDVRVLTAQHVALDSPQAEQLPTLFPGSVCARVLLVEDDDINRTMIASMLEHMGHVVDAVSGGRDALAAIGRDDYDIVVTDLRMPGIDGAELARRIKALSPPKRSVSVIALSADTVELTRLAASSEFRAFIAKPIDWQKLHKTIQAELAGLAAADADATHADVDRLGR